MSASTELATQERSGIIELSKENIEKIRDVPALLNEFYKNILQKDTDYGQIFGTPKPSLWKPGAELLQMAAKLHSESKIIAQIEPDGKGVFFSYTVECKLYNQFNEYVGNGFGSCNSKETRYAFRWLFENQIPEGADKSKHPTRTINSKDGKQKFTQWRFDTPDDEIYTLQNTIIKMAKKRAFIDAILSVTGASRIFTQDIEDDAYSSVEEEAPKDAKNVTPKVKQEPETKEAAAEDATTRQKPVAQSPVSASPDVRKIIDSTNWHHMPNEPDREFAFASMIVGKGQMLQEVKPLISAIESAKGKLVLVEDGVNFAYTYDGKAERVYRSPVSGLEASEK